MASATRYGARAHRRNEPFAVVLPDELVLNTPAALPR